MASSFLSLNILRMTLFVYDASVRCVKRRPNGSLARSAEV